MKNEWPIPVFGLTGSIASGKTAAGRVFAGMGGELIDADVLLREVTKKGKPAHGRIVEAFGKGVLDAGGEIDREVLGRIVFGDGEKKARLEGITHGEIMREADSRIRRIASGRFVPVFLEAALIVETGLHEALDGLVVVVCDRKLQVERLRRRRGMSEEEIRSRIEAQLSSREKAEAADWIIENDGTLEDLRRRAEEVFGEIRRSEAYAAKLRSATRG